MTEPPAWARQLADRLLEAVANDEKVTFIMPPDNSRASRNQPPHIVILDDIAGDSAVTDEERADIHKWAEKMWPDG
jgi:hypothetical protein